MEYVMYAVGLFFALMAWLSNRAVNANDKRIEQLEEMVADLQEQIDVIKEERSERSERTNQRFSDLDKDVTDRINGLALQLAKLIK